ncbi:MAG: S8 family serine peptidase [Phycisphaerales bacterium]|nr:S8 family serine peptidase [Phycisphaerales bacterium]
MRLRIMARAAAAAGAFASLSSAFAAVDQGQAGYHYTYHKQIKPLSIDTSRIAVLADDVEAVKAAVVAAKLDGGTVSPHGLSKWYLVSGFGVADGARIERAVATLAVQPGISFASPVFFDLFDGPMFPTRDLIVGFSAGQPGAARDAIVDRVIEVEARRHDWMPDVDVATVKSQNGFDVLNASNALAAMGATLFAEPDMVFSGRGGLIPNDPQFGDLWGLRNTGQAGGLNDFDMNASEAWDVHAGSSAIIDVVIDVGVDMTHPDLNLGPGADFTGNGTAGDPGNSCDHHGTAVAGCISARINNSLGVVGAAPGCRVASARCFVSTIPCSGSWNASGSWTVDALNWAQSIGARVTNNSNGYGFTSGAIDTAYTNTRNAGIVHFASAGNNGTGTIGYPASLGPVNAVAALDRFGNRAGFSQFGTGLDFSAPGVTINSTDRQGAPGYTGGDYNVVDGTSFASPYASAVACLILSRNSSLTAAQVETIMANTCRDLGSAGYDTGFGWGLVNAQAALNAIVPPGDGCSSPVGVGVGSYANTLVGAGNPTLVGGVCGGAGANPDVWYSFIAPVNGVLTASTCGTHDAAGVDTGIDTVLSLHASCTDAASTCSDDAPGACGASDGGIQRDSVVTQSMSAGQAALVRVSKFGGGAVGPFTLNISFAAANDACASAQDVSSGGTFFGDLAYTNNETNFPAMCGAAQTNPDAWYSFTAPATCPVSLTVSTCGTHDGPGLNLGMDTVLSLHTACVGAPVACLDDTTTGCTGLDSGIFRDSSLTRTLAAGETILIRVSKFSTVTAGAFQLNVSATAANDACAAALPIAAGVPTPFCSHTATTDGPTESACLSFGDDNVHRDLWYTYTTRGAGRFTVRTCGSAFDTRAVIYTAACPLPSTPNTALACNDDAGGICPSNGLNSSVSAVGAANTTYRVRVGGYSGAGGDGVVIVYCSADINLSGMVSVQDIFDFLSLYFAPSPVADINGSNTVTVQDLFDFLAAYFAGCA